MVIDDINRGPRFRLRADGIHFRVRAHHFVPLTASPKPFPTEAACFFGREGLIKLLLLVIQLPIKYNGVEVIVAQLLSPRFFLQAEKTTFAQL